MATIHDLIEVTGISPFTTYSTANGNLLGIVDNVTSSALDDGEFDEGDDILIDGTFYNIDEIEEPRTSGTFLLGDGSSRTFNSGSESNLSVAFLTVSSGGTTRYFIIPNDSFGDMGIQAITTGNINAAAGSDAAIISTADNDINVVCFTIGTLIQTKDHKMIAVDDLAQGDQVLTLDRGLQPIKWVGAKEITPSMMAANPHLRPIRIKVGALGNGLPRQDLLVSPQHRILATSKIAERMFDASEVLVAAKHLVHLDGINVAQDIKSTKYFHFLLKNHEIVFANGAACESLFVGPQAKAALPDEAQDEIFELAPSLVGTTLAAHALCRPVISGKHGQKLAERHQKNAQPLAIRDNEKRPELESAP